MPDRSHSRGRTSLSPEMACFRALVRVFVRDYIAEWDVSPSYGEIAAHFDCSKTRVKQAVLSLARDGLLVRVPGTRGLRMPGEREEALRKLRELGWRVDEADLIVRAPARPPGGPITNPPLLPPPELDYPSHPTGTEEGRDEAPED